MTTFMSSVTLLAALCSVWTDQDAYMYASVGQSAPLVLPDKKFEDRQKVDGISHRRYHCYRLHEQHLVLGGPVVHYHHYVRHNVQHVGQLVHGLIRRRADAPIASLTLVARAM